MVETDLLALDLMKISLFCLHSSINKFEAVLMKLCHNVCCRKISDEFDYGHDRTSITRVMGP